MGWGNPTPLAQLKRDAAKVRRLERRIEFLETWVKFLLGHFPPPNRCEMCVSAYAECPLHRGELPA